MLNLPQHYPRITVINSTYAKGGARDLVMEYVSWSLNCLSILTQIYSRFRTKITYIYQTNTIVRNFGFWITVFIFFPWPCSNISPISNKIYLRWWSSPESWPIWSPIWCFLPSGDVADCGSWNYARWFSGGTWGSTSWSRLLSSSVQTSALLHQEDVLPLLFMHTMDIPKSWHWGTQRPKWPLHQLCSWWTPGDSRMLLVTILWIHFPPLKNVWKIPCHISCILEPCMVNKDCWPCHLCSASWAICSLSCDWVCPRTTLDGINGWKLFFSGWELGLNFWLTPGKSFFGKNGQNSNYPTNRSI